MLRAVTAKHRLARLATTLQIRRSSTKPHYVSTPIFYVNAGTFAAQPILQLLFSFVDARAILG